MGSRGFEVAGGKLIRSPSRSQAAREQLQSAREAVGDNDEESASFMEKLAREAKGKRVAAGGSLLASFQRSKSFAPATKDTSTQKGRQPFKRVATIGPTSSEDAFWGLPGGGDIGPVLAQGGADLPVASGSRSHTPEPAIARESSFMVAGSSRGISHKVLEKKAIFKGLTFRALGEARSASVKTAVEEAGGTLTDDQDADVDYIVVRLARFVCCILFQSYCPLIKRQTVAAIFSKKSLTTHCVASIVRSVGWSVVCTKNEYARPRNTFPSCR